MSALPKKPVCKFCQRSRWLLVITSLVMMASVVWLQTGSSGFML